MTFCSQVRRTCGTTHFIRPCTILHATGIGLPPNFEDCIGQCWFFYPHFYAVFWQPFWKWQTSWKFWKRRIAPLIVTYHYVKFYVSIIIQLEGININVRNFKFPIGFYSYSHPLWTPKNMALTPFTTNLKTLGSTRNIYL